jgi:hypothetical protein
MTLGLTDLVVNPSLQPHVVAYEEPSGEGRDNSGGRVPTFVQVYAALTCAVRLDIGGGMGFGGGDVHGQSQSGLTGRVYIARQLDGTMPTIRKRGRFVFGTWSDGTPRYLNISSEEDALEKGVILEVSVKAVAPG